MRDIKLITVSSGTNGDCDVLFVVTSDNKIYKMVIGQSKGWEELPSIPNNEVEI